MLEKMRERRAALKAELDAINLAVETRADLKYTVDEDARFTAIVEEIRQVDVRIDELTELAARQAAADTVAVQEQRAADGRETVAFGSGVRSEPNPIYRSGDSSSPSFFRDLAAFQLNRADFLGANGGGIQEARGRLASSQETRAGDVTTVAGAGGEFDPPTWLVSDYIAKLRAGRVSANLMQHEVLPTGTASINLPAVSGGTTTGVQALQNSSVSDTAMTTTSVASGITTIAGKQIVSMQQMSQSGIPFDRVVLGDLARDYAKQLDLQVLSGSGASGQLRGLKNAAGLGTTTYTSAAPAVVSVTTANSFYNRIISAVNAIEAVFITPNAIIMHPQRWNWVLEGLDGSNRPLVLPNGQVFNALGSSEGPNPEGAAGSLLGIPVYKDANIPVNIGGGTNQDVVYVLNTEQCWLYESPLQSASFDATYADQASILFRVLGYSAFIPDRYAGAVNAMNGTGLVTPTL